MNVVKVQPKPKRRGLIRGQKPGWKKAIVQLARGRRRSRSSRGPGLMRASREVQADPPGPPLHDRLDVRGGHEVEAREEPHRAAEEEGRPQQQRPHHDAPPGRRPQAPLPHDRLQARQGRRAGEGRRDRVRPEPLGAHRAAPLRGRREGVHPRAGAAAGRRDGRVRPGRRHQAGQRAAARRTSRPARSCTTSS